MEIRAKQFSEGTGRQPEPEYQTPTTVNEVREWVTGKDGEYLTDGQGLRGEILLLYVRHSNLKTVRLHELRVDGLSTVSELKQKLYLHTGTRPASMRIYVESNQGIELCEGSGKTLLQYGVRNGHNLVIIDEDPFSVSANGWLEDVSLVKKKEFKEEYDKSENTYRKHKQRMREKDPTWSITSALKNKQLENEPEPQHIIVGQRASVFPGDRRGVVMYKGKDLAGLPKGWWVGVQYDEPVGKHDGSVKDVRYFSCPPKYGGMVRVANLRVGDYPPLSLGEDGEDDDDDDEL